MSARVLATTAEYLASPTRFFDRRTDDHAGFFRASTLPYGSETFVTDPVLARAIFASPDLHGGVANLAHRIAVGERSVSSLDGAAHLARRRLLGPVVAAGRAALASERSRERALRALSRVPERRAFPIDGLVRAVVLEAMLEAAFGVLDPSVRALGASFARLVDQGRGSVGQLGIMPALQLDFPGSPWRRFVKQLGRIDDVIHRRIDLAAGGEADAGMLGALLAARDEDGQALSRGSVRDDVLTLLGAGFETTATTILWALSHVLGHAPTREAIVAGDELVLDGAIRESLRLRPTLPTVRRVAMASFSHGPLALVRGDKVVLVVHRLQRHAASVTSPDTFDPLRTDGARTSFAFGGGPRVCPGMGLALGHARGVLQALVPALVSADRRPARAAFRGATLAPATPITVSRTGGCPFSGTR